MYIRSVVQGIVAAIRPHREWAFRIAGGSDEWIPRMFEWKPDGIVACVYNRPICNELRKLNVPIVNFSSSAAGVGLPTVRVDNTRIGAMAAEHLLGLGLKQFAYWSGYGTQFSTDRAAGFFQTLRERDVSDDCLHSLVVHEGEHWQQRDQVIGQWLTALPKPVGIMGAHDAQAYYLSDLAHEAGIGYPH